MTFWVIVGDVLCAAVGGAAVWFGKDQMQRAWFGAAEFSARLRAKAERIAEAARKV